MSISVSQNSYSHTASGSTIDLIDQALVSYSALATQQQATAKAQEVHALMQAYDLSKHSHMRSPGMSEAILAKINAALGI